VFPFIFLGNKLHCAVTFPVVSLGNSKSLRHHNSNAGLFSQVGEAAQLLIWGKIAQYICERGRKILM
jgi:hypothetical protein